jgi:hypothetical protein
MAMSGSTGQSFNSASLGYSAPVQIRRNPLGISTPAILNNIGVPLLVAGGLMVVGLALLTKYRRK